MSDRSWMDPSGRPLPVVTARQMREIDRIMVEELGVGLAQMMELAGRHLARVARKRFLERALPSSRVLVMAGRGGNGGGALVAARRLYGWGTRVLVVTAHESDSHAGVPADQLETLGRLEVPVVPWVAARGLRTPDLVIDGLLGYGVEGAPRDSTREMIRWANGVAAPVLSLDVPSGLDPTDGTPHDPTVLAAATVALALPKSGFEGMEAKAHLGELYLGDIGVPANAYRAPGLDLDVSTVFESGDLIHLR